jgi:hypothetical protein
VSNLSLSDAEPIYMLEDDIFTKPKSSSSRACCGHVVGRCGTTTGMGGRFGGGT